MTFAHTVEQVRNIAGDRRIATGTFAQTAGDTGGNIDLSHFQIVDYIGVQAVTSMIATAAPCINETFPLQGESTAAIITSEALQNGVFIIYGS